MHLVDTAQLVDVSTSDHPFFSGERCRKLTIKLFDLCGIPIITHTLYLEVKDQSDEDLERLAKKHLRAIYAPDLAP